MLAAVTAHLLVALVLAAPLTKPTGAAKQLVGAWYQGDTQYIQFKDDGTGLLGMLEMQWSVDKPGTIHLVFREDGAEKNLAYAQNKADAITVTVDARELELKRGKPKVFAAPEDKDKDSGKDGGTGKPVKGKIKKPASKKTKAPRAKT